MKSSPEKYARTLPAPPRLAKPARLLWVALVGLSLLAMSCSEAPSTQIVVLMDTDYAVPMEVDRIRAQVSKRVESEGGPEELETWRKLFSVAKDGPGEPDAHQLPATFAILAENADLDREIVIELEAIAAGGSQTLVSRRVRTKFVPGEARLVRMALFRACAEIDCSSEQACGCEAGAACGVPKCVDELLSPKSLEIVENPGLLPANPGIPGDGIEPDPGDPSDINCNAPLLVCETDCVNPDADPRYCGDCTTSCPSGHVCSGGGCMDPADCRSNGLGCPGFSYCDDASGECLTGCTLSEQCTGNNEACDTDAHECVCAPGFDPCGDACVDTQSSTVHCGDCNRACPEGYVCDEGDCVDQGDCRSNGLACPEFTYCDDASGDCLTGCILSEQCPGNNEICDTDANECVCATGFTRCGTGCVDIQTSTVHCGECDRSCLPGYLCEAGNCRNPQDCRSNGEACPGFTYCDEATGECLAGCSTSPQCAGDNEICDTDTHECICSSGSHRCGALCLPDDDVNSCGTSCTPCTVADEESATPICAQGACDFVCNSGFYRCDETTCCRCPPGNPDKCD